MKLVILTSDRYGMAPRVLPALCANPNLTVERVIFSHGGSLDRKKLIKRKLEKTLRVGILGAINGVRMRSWFADDETDEIESLCNELGVTFCETNVLNSEPTRELMREARADLGLSLGNGYIAKSVFTIPEDGMVNIHSEILPQFQGAMSVLWPIYEGVEQSGFTIHQIDSSIDTGEILYQEKYPLEFYPSLQETVEKNIASIRLKIPNGFSHVCENYQELKQNAIVQKHGKTYTTPTFMEFLRMRRNHRAMYRESLAKRPA